MWARAAWLLACTMCVYSGWLDACVVTHCCSQVAGKWWAACTAGQLATPHVVVVDRLLGKSHPSYVQPCQLQLPGDVLFVMRDKQASEALDTRAQHTWKGLVRARCCAACSSCCSAATPSHLSSAQATIVDVH